MSGEDPLERMERSLYCLGWAVLMLFAGLVVLTLCFGVAIMVR